MSYTVRLTVEFRQWLADLKDASTRQRLNMYYAQYGRTLDMSKTIRISELPEFDAAEFLQSDEDTAAYLTAVLEDNDPALLAAALGDIARARGMARIAKDAGMAREALYKALRPGSQPRLETILRVCAALGVRLVAQPLHAPADPQPGS